MSDQQQAPDWWMASDGRWYPPQLAPTPVEPISAPPPVRKTGLMVAAGVVAVLVLVVAAALLFGGGDDDDERDLGSSSTTTEATPPADPDDTDDTSGADGPADDGDLLPGFTLLEGDGVALAAPEAWVQIEAADAALGSEEVADLYPGANEALLEEGLAAFERGAVLVATDVTGSTFEENVNVLEAPAEVPLDVLEEQGEQEITALGGRVNGVERVALPAGEAVRLAYSIDGVAPDGSPFTVQGVQFYVPVDGRTYIITVSSDRDPSPISDPMAESFRLR